MKWTGPKQGKLREALLETYGDRGIKSLELFINDHFECSLVGISTDNPEDWATALIKQFVADGQLINQLYQTLCQQKRNHPAIQQLQRDLTGTTLQSAKQPIVLASPNTTGEADFPFELPEDYEDLQLESFLPGPADVATDVGKLNRAAEAVCRISFKDNATTGTGVLIGPRLVLTNYHVLSKRPIEQSHLTQKASSLLFEFGYVSNAQNIPTQPKTFSVDRTQPIAEASNPDQLDYVLLRVEPSFMDSSHNPIKIPQTPVNLQKKDSLNVLHHPAGALMEASLSASGIVDINTHWNKVWYVNRTKGGSSGAPCFNKNWELVALHHASMSRGFGSIREGILMTAILADIERSSNVELPT